MVSGRTFGQCLFETPLSRLDPESDIHFGLLLFVAAEETGSVLRDDVAELFWPGQDVESTRHRLRQAMYRLRQLDVPIRLRSGRVVLTLDECTLDVRAILHGTPPRSELIRLGELPFLPSYAPRISDPFSHWVEELRRRVSGRLRRALSDEIAEAKSHARYGQVGQLARALLTFDPLNEVATFGLAESLALEGSKVEAIRMLEAYEKEVGAVSGDLRLPVRLLRHRVSECLNDSLLPRRFEVPFVGREEEFRELRTLLRAARDGTAQSAIVTGEAGIGKTRLAGELLRIAAIEGATVASYTTSAGDTFTPLSTLISVSQILLSLPGALGCAEEQLSFVRRLGTPETVTAWSLSEIAADIAYAQMLNALAELVAAIADEAPLVLLVDDAHRLHQTTWRILVDLLERVSDRRVLLLLTARQLPSWFGTLGAASCERLTRHVRLQPFGRAESLQYLEIWSGRNVVPISSDEASRCATTSLGNPFYLGELAGHIGRGGDPLQAPSSIKELIEVQRAALSKHAQRMLLAIALFESRATVMRVTAVFELPSGESIASLEELEDAGLILVKGAVLQCKHDLVAAVAVAISTQSVQSFIRAHIARLLEREADATNSVELLGDCVSQWERAGELKRACDAAMKLGHRLVGLGMGIEAENAYRRAQRSAQSDRETVLAIEGQMIACRLSGRHDAIDALAQERTQTLRHYRNEVHYDEFELLASEADVITLSTPPDPERLLFLASAVHAPDSFRIRAAVLLAILSDNRLKSVDLRQAFEAVQTLLPGTTPTADTLLLQTIYHCAIGDGILGFAFAKDMAELARTSPDHTARLKGLRRAGYALLRIGQYATAESLTRESLALASSLRLPLQQLSCLESLAMIGVATRNISLAAQCAAELYQHHSASSPVSSMICLGVESLLAWIHSDRELAGVLLNRAGILPRPLLPRALQALLSIETGMALVTGEMPSPERVAMLEEFHYSARAFGSQDFATSVLVAALRGVNRGDDARRLSSEYLSTRRREGATAPEWTRL